MGFSRLMNACGEKWARLLSVEVRAIIRVSPPHVLSKVGVVTDGRIFHD